MAPASSVAAAAVPGVVWVWSARATLARVAQSVAAARGGAGARGGHRPHPTLRGAEPAGQRSPPGGGGGRGGGGRGGRRVLRGASGRGRHVSRGRFREEIPRHDHPAANPTRSAEA